MLKSILGRVHVTADGFLIGRIVPKDDKLNHHENLNPNHVYELMYCDFSCEMKLVDLGPAKFQPERLMSMDQFVVHARGEHLIVGKESIED